MLKIKLIFPNSVSEQGRCIPKLPGCKIFSHRAVMHDQRYICASQAVEADVYCGKMSMINVELITGKYLLDNSSSWKQSRSLSAAWVSCYVSLDALKGKLQHQILNVKWQISCWCLAHLTQRFSSFFCLFLICWCRLILFVSSASWIHKWLCSLGTSVLFL